MIGVCIVTYNHENYIAQCIESVLEQDYRDDVILYIGEDNSTDKTRDLCEEYQRKYPDKIVLIPHKTNLGLVKNTFNLFARMTQDKCDYIAMLDGDDYWCDKQKLSKSMRIFEDNPSCGLVHSNIALQYGNKIDLNIRKGIPSGMVWPVKFAIGNCSVIFKTELLQYINAQDYVDRGFMSVDYPMYITLSKYTEIHFLDDITAVWRRGHSSVSNTNDINKQIYYLQNAVRMWKYLDDLFGIYEATPENIQQWVDNESFNIAYKYRDYKNAFNAIRLARENQIAITQREMEIQIIDLNRGYLSYNNICLGNEKKHSIEIEIKYLKDTRDNHLNNAISNALTIVENDIKEKKTFSTATILLNSILSLLAVVKDSFKISFINRSNLSLISSRLIYADSSMFQLRNSIEELKKKCGVI